MADSAPEVVFTLLNNDRCQINSLDHHSRSALHWAALLGKSATCRLLLDHHARYHSQDVNGATPLHYAVEAGCKETVETLMRCPKVATLYGVINRSCLAGFAFYSFFLL